MIRAEIIGHVSGETEHGQNARGAYVSRQAFCGDASGRHLRVTVSAAAGSRLATRLEQLADGERIEASGKIEVTVWESQQGPKPRAVMHAEQVRRLKPVEQHRRTRPGEVGERSGDGARHAPPEGSVPILPAPASDTAPALFSQQNGFSNSFEGAAE